MDQPDLRTLRRALTSRRRGRGRLPTALRAPALAYARRRRRDGAGVAAIAAELGLCSETIRRWTRGPMAAVAPAGLVPIEVVADDTPAPRALTLHSPSGFRIDGLSLDEAAALLRALR